MQKREQLELALKNYVKVYEEITIHNLVKKTSHQSNTEILSEEARSGRREQQDFVAVNSIPYLSQESNEDKLPRISGSISTATKHNKIHGFLVISTVIRNFFSKAVEALRKTVIWCLGSPSVPILSEPFLPKLALFRTQGFTQLAFPIPDMVRKGMSL